MGSTRSLVAGYRDGRVGLLPMLSEYAPEERLPPARLRPGRGSRTSTTGALRGFVQCGQQVGCPFLIMDMIFLTAIIFGMVFMGGYTAGKRSRDHDDFW